MRHREKEKDGDDTANNSRSKGDNNKEEEDREPPRARAGGRRRKKCRFHCVPDFDDGSSDEDAILPSQTKNSKKGSSLKKLKDSDEGDRKLTEDGNGSNGKEAQGTGARMILIQAE